jgi:hypothetical protein
MFAALASAQVNKPNSVPADKTTTDPGVESQNDKPQQFDILFRVKEEKLDTNVVNQIVRGYVARLNSSGLAPVKDYQIYLSHDTIQVRFLNNTRSYKDWYSLLVRQGFMQVHLTSDSLYNVKVDSANVPKGYVILPDIDLKTTHYVSNQVLNGNLVQLQSTIEKFDEPTLTGQIMPRDTQYQSFMFRKGMRIVVVVDGVIYNSAVVVADSAAVNTFQLMTQYPPPLTYIMDRVIRFPLSQPVDLIKVQPIKEETDKKK